MRILLLDIENLPLVVRLYGPTRVKYIPPSNIKEEGDILCFAAKWLGSRKFFFHAAYGEGDKQAMLQAAWDLLDEADVVMTYYGRRHDIPILNREFLLAGMKPPSPYKQIDLYFVIRQTFGFDYKSLDYVSKRLGLKGKTKTGGLLDLMLLALEGDERAQRLLRRYNTQDVRLLEQLYHHLQPWIKGHPSHGAFDGADSCPYCGSLDREKRGFAYTQVSKFQRYRCQNCGGWSQSSKREVATTVREAA